MRQQLETMLDGGITTPLGKQKHLAPIAGQPLKVDVNLLGKLILQDHGAALVYFDRMTAGPLLILAWETTKGRHTKDPLWEFLFHCRNAAAHNGAFRLLNGNPKHPAEWRRTKIVSSLHGQPLLADPPAPGFMGPGDPFYLLADIEATLL